MLLTGVLNIRMWTSRFPCHIGWDSLVTYMTELDEGM